MFDDVDFLNECANYFEKKALESKEDITIQSFHNNARNLRRIAADLNRAIEIAFD